MRAFPHSQLRFLALVLATWLTVFACTRTVLLVTHLHEATISAWPMMKIYVIGFLYDVTFLSYAALPLTLYLLLCPIRIWQARWHRIALTVLFGTSLFAMLFTALAEWLFWDEFSVRFNFIAVDYLVYSDEVVRNIMESYPVFSLIGLLAILAATVTLLIQPTIARLLRAEPAEIKGRIGAAAAITITAAILAVAVDQDVNQTLRDNTYQRELASNGPYQFFAAFRNNELDYQQFYASLPENEIAGDLRREVEEPNSRFTGTDPQDIRRFVDNAGMARQPNIILVTVESLSAKYLGSFGNTAGLTPNLDALRQESLFFNNFYATGTRTDRGLEAITLSVPPTPGRSIVKRIGKETGYGSLGQQLKQVGYDSAFIYGGRGYFDNMNAFFSGNGYRIVDQSSVPESEIHFANAWGMADEDLFTQAIKVADGDDAAHRPFFLHLMTTSNHRPYSYPDGRIDIPSGSGRDGAVKYTDWAIGDFLNRARQQPWFDNTIFVFVADHCAGSAGRQDLPVANYHIPLFIYAPKLIQPREFDGLASQIDIAPTLLGLLNMDYVSTFFGRNLLMDHPKPGRALIGNYQHLGLFDGKDLAILSPRKQIRTHSDAQTFSREQNSTTHDPLVKRDIAYYQGASHDYTAGLLAWHGPQPEPARHNVVSQK
ncbi:LTA synthase family protein [Pseudomonas sp. Marseille-QA0892]